LRCSHFSLLSLLRRYLGFSIIVLSDRVANFSNPISTPITLLVLGKSIGSTSQAKHTYQLFTSRFIVQVLIVPLILRCSLTLIVPILDSFSLLSVKLKPD